MGSTGVPVVDEDAASAALDLFPEGIGEEHGDESVRFEEDELRLVSTMVKNCLRRFGIRSQRIAKKKKMGNFVDKNCIFYTYN